MSHALDSENTTKLLHLAKEATQYAHAPYSNFPVGAAVLCDDGSTYTGCNIELVINGLSLCAERVAIAKAVSEGKKDFTAIAVWSEKRPNGAITPCGACRQVMLEFFKPEGTVIMSDSNSGKPKSVELQALMPDAYVPTHLV